MSRREEWQEQIKLSRLLDKWLDPTCSYWTATDPVAGSPLSGLMRKRRGIKPGQPDIVVWYRGRSLAIEMKSRHGQCTPSQRAARAGLLRAGIDWWECRSANAAMVALRRSRVRFREVVREDGPIERWRQPKLAPWEEPRRDPAEPRPRAPQDPEVAAEHRAATARWRERKRAPEIARLEAQPTPATLDPQPAASDARV